MVSFYRMDPVIWDHATVDLSLEEEAAYLRICNAIYRSERGCPTHDRVLAGMFRCSTRKARALVASLLDKGKIFIRDGHLWNEKADREINSIRNPQPKPDRNEAEPKAKPTRNADEMPMIGERNDREPGMKADRIDAERAAKPLKEAILTDGDPPPKTRLEETRQEKIREEKQTLESVFERLWIEYPRRLTESGTQVKGSRQEAFRAFQALSPEDRSAAVEGLAGFKRVYPDASKAVPDCVRYLKNQRWRDVEGLAQKPSPGIVLPKNGLAPRIQRLIGIISLPKYRAWFESNGACLIEPRGEGAVIRAPNQFAMERIEKDFFSPLNTAFGFGQWKVEIPRPQQTEAAVKPPDVSRSTKLPQG